jgi:hypothetical protein
VQPILTYGCEIWGYSCSLGELKGKLVFLKGDSYDCRLLFSEQSQSEENMQRKHLPTEALSQDLVRTGLPCLVAQLADARILNLDLIKELKANNTHP